MTVHISPLNDLVDHTTNGDDDCVCGPDIEYANPETGVAYPDGPLVIHHSLDGRETEEDEDENQT